MLRVGLWSIITTFTHVRRPLQRKARPTFGYFHHVYLKLLFSTHYNIDPRHRGAFAVFLWQAPCPSPLLEHCNLPSLDIDGSWCMDSPHPTHTFHRKQCYSLPAWWLWPLEGNRFVDLRINAVIILQSGVSKCTTRAWNSPIKKPPTPWGTVNFECFQFTSPDINKTRFCKDASPWIATFHSLFNSHRGNDCRLVGAVGIIHTSLSVFKGLVLFLRGKICEFYSFAERAWVDVAFAQL